jgi:hypothetical protein
VAIHVEVSLVAMHSLANPIRKPSYRKDVGSSVKEKRIPLAEALAGEDLIFDWDEARVVGLE